MEPSPTSGRADRRNSSGSRRVRVDEAIAELARSQHRQITREQLRSVGCDDDAIDYRVEIGRLHRAFTGVYSIGGPPLSPKELWMAATLTYGPGAKLAALAAVDLYGWLRYPLGGLYVLTPTPRRPRHGIVPMHRTFEGRSQRIDGIPVTGPEQTVLDCAALVRSDRAYRRIVRAAQVDDTTHARLLAFAASHPGLPGIHRMRKELADGPIRTRSVNEDEVLEIFRKGGEPLVNHRFAADLEADLYFPKLGAVVEVDSVFHDGPTAHADDARRDERYRALGLTPYRLRKTEPPRR